MWNLKFNVKVLESLRERLLRSNSNSGRRKSFFRSDFRNQSKRTGFFVLMFLISICSAQIFASKPILASEAASDKACALVFSALLRQVRGLDAQDRVVGRSREITQLEALLEANKNILLAGESGSGKTTLIELFVREYQEGRLDQFKPGSLVFARFDWRDAALLAREGSLIDGSRNLADALTKLLESSSGKKLILHVPDFDLFMIEIQRRPDLSHIAIKLKEHMSEGKIKLIGELSGRPSKEAFKDELSSNSPSSIEEMIRLDSPFKDYFEMLHLEPLTGEQMILAMSLEAARVKKETGISFEADALKALLTFAGNEFNYDVSLLRSAKKLLHSMSLEKSRSLKDGSSFELSRINREIDDLRSDIKILEGVPGLESILEAQKSRLLSFESTRNQRMSQLERDQSSEAPLKPLREKIRELELEMNKESDPSRRMDLLAEHRANERELEALLQKRESSQDSSHITVEAATQWASDVLGKEVAFSAKDFDNLLRKRESASSIRIIENPEVTFTDVIGHESAKNMIRRAHDKLNNLDFAEETGTDGPTRIITYGPPGTGKSLFLKAAARELDSIYVEMNIADLMTKWQGESEANIKAFWREIQRRGKTGQRILIAMEEVDSLARDRDANIGNDTKSTMLNITLTELQTLSDMKLPNIVIIANTNKPWALDSAFTRAGRFDREIYFGLPERVHREALLEKSFEKYEARLPQNWREIMKELSEQMEGWSAAEITDGFSRQVRENIFEELVKAREEGRPTENWRLTQEKVREVFEELKESFPSTSRIDLEAFLNYRDRNAQKRQEIDGAEPGSLMGQQ